MGCTKLIFLPLCAIFSLVFSVSKIAQNSSVLFKKKSISFFDKLDSDTLMASYKHASSLMALIQIKLRFFVK